MSKTPAPPAVFEYRWNGTEWIIISPVGEWTCEQFVQYAMDFFHKNFARSLVVEDPYEEVFFGGHRRLIETRTHCGFEKDETTGALRELPSITRSWVRMMLDYAQSFAFTRTWRVIREDEKARGEKFNERALDAAALDAVERFSEHLIGHKLLFGDNSVKRKK